jgi:hypothetical protein
VAAVKGFAWLGRTRVKVAGCEEFWSTEARSDHGLARSISMERVIQRIKLDTRLRHSKSCCLRCILRFFVSIFPELFSQGRLACGWRFVLRNNQRRDYSRSRCCCGN